MNGTPHLSRRAFLCQGSKAATVVGTAPYFVPASAFAAPGRSGANDRLRIGVIGIGIRGRQLISNMPAGGQVVALCDCATSRVADAMNPIGLQQDS